MQLHGIICDLLTILYAQYNVLLRSILLFRVFILSKPYRRSSLLKWLHALAVTMQRLYSILFFVGWAIEGFCAKIKVIKWLINYRKLIQCDNEQVCHNVLSCIDWDVNKHSSYSDNFETPKEILSLHSGIRINSTSL